MKIYSYSYNIETGKAKAFVDQVDNDDDYSSQNPALLEDEIYEVAIYDDFHENSVYCESLVSIETAKLLVLQKCDELMIKFSAAKYNIWKNNPEIHL